MLKKITIENFKGIKEPLSIDIKPITLLFGPNNAGKSSIIQALHFAREIFINNNLNPHITETGGEDMDLGGFKNLIHNHDLKSAITLTFYFRFDKEIPFIAHEETQIKDKDIKALALSKTLDLSFKINSSLRNIKGLSVRFRLKWDEKRKESYIELCRIKIDNYILFEIVKLIKFNYKLKMIVYNHPIIEVFKELLELQSDKEYQEHCEVAFYEQHLLEELHQAYLDSSYKYMSDEETDWSETFDDMDAEDWEQHMGGEDYEEQYQDEREQHQDKRDETIEEAINNILKTSSPKYKSNYMIDSFDLVENSPLLLSEDGLISKKEPFRRYESYLNKDKAEIYQNTLSNIAKKSILIVKEALEPFFYIGPLRKIPARNNTVSEQTDRSKWSSGLSAYDIISQSDNNFINEVNNWLSTKKGFNTEYNIQCKRYKQLDIESELMNILINNDSFKSKNQYRNAMIKKQLLSLPEKSEFFLLKKNCDIKLFLQDVGTGISQILPIIVGALKLNSEQNNSFLAIEQPELHIHPAMQIILGDFFIKQVSDSNLNLIIETHSEHLLLRILRRISETTNNELPSGVKGFQAKDLAVLYVKNIDGNTTVTVLEVDESGDFKNKWPDGFFEERDEELFLK